MYEKDFDALDNIKFFHNEDIMYTQKKNKKSFTSFLPVPLMIIAVDSHFTFT